MSLGACFSKVPKGSRTRKAIAKSGTLWLQSCSFHIFLIWTEVPFIQQVSVVYTSPFLETDEQKKWLNGPEKFRAFQESGPRGNYLNGWGKHLDLGSSFNEHPRISCPFWETKRLQRCKKASVLHVPRLLQKSLHHAHNILLNYFLGRHLHRWKSRLQKDLVSQKDQQIYM